MTARTRARFALVRARVLGEFLRASAAGEVLTDKELVSTLNFYTQSGAIAIGDEPGVKLWEVRLVRARLVEEGLVRPVLSSAGDHFPMLGWELGEPWGLPGVQLELPLDERQEVGG